MSFLLGSTFGVRDTSGLCYTSGLRGASLPWEARYEQRLPVQSACLLPHRNPIFFGDAVFALV